MGFREGAYATVWEVARKEEKRSQIRISISSRGQSKDEYINSFSGYVTLIGNAHNKVELLEKALANEKYVRIRLCRDIKPGEDNSYMDSNGLVRGVCDSTNTYSKEKGEKSYYTLFDFILVDASGAAVHTETEQKKKAAPKPAAPSPLTDDEDDGSELPF